MRHIIPPAACSRAEELGAIADMVRGRPIWVLSDEIYSRIIYEGSHASILAHPGMQEQTILLDGHSKTYAMTGWRLGYGVMPVALAEKVGLILNNAVSCTASFTQIAGIEALTGPQDSVEAMVAEFRRRRDAFIGALNAIDGLSCLLPHGAFYAFCNVKELGVVQRAWNGIGWRKRVLPRSPARALALRAKATCGFLSRTRWKT